jgi:hypothetical protein
MTDFDSYQKTERHSAWAGEFHTIKETRPARPGYRRMRKMIAGRLALRHVLDYQGRDVSMRNATTQALLTETRPFAHTESVFELISRATSTALQIVFKVHIETAKTTLKFIELSPYC